MTLEVRSFEIRKVNHEARTIEGIAAPLDSEYNLNEFKERYGQGVFADFVEGQTLPLYAEHDHLVAGLPVGRLVEGRNTDQGFAIKAVFNNSAKANEVYTMVKEGDLRSFSAGFVPREVDYDENTNTVTITRGDLLEVSVVGIPAYKTAGITAVRSMAKDLTARDAAVSKDSETHRTSENTNNTKGDINMSDISTINDRIEVIERNLEVLKTSESNVSPVTTFRSAGEALYALANGDEMAKRAFTGPNGATTADSHTGNDWKGVLLGIVDKGRPLFNLFTTGPLGGTGMNVEYAKVTSITGNAAVQAAEGDNLAMVKIAFGTGTAPVKTVGCYSDLSRQVIQRSDVAYLDTVLRAQAAAYADVTNALVRTALTGATAQTGTSFGLGAATGKNFLTAVMDGIQKINDNGKGATADFILVSADVYAALFTMVDTAGRPVFTVNGDGANTFGSVDVRNAAGTLAGLPVVVDSTLAARTFYVASANSVNVWESPGAPVRLQDENIINLTQQFSLHGFVAVAAVNPDGLVKATIAV